MNTKLTAVLMAAIMVATCAAVIVSADQAEAKSGDEIEVDPVNFTNGTGILNLYINENEYTGYAKSVTWSYSDAKNGTYTAIGPDGNIKVENVSVDNGVVVGKYKFTFSDQGSVDKTMWLKCRLVVTVDQQKEMELYYKVPLNIDGGNDGGVIGDDNILTLPNMEATVMQQFNKVVYLDNSAITESEVISKYQGYNWYAVGLPEGLSMNMNGTVTGVPTKATSSEGVTVAVVAVDKSNNTQYSTTFTFKVDAGLVDNNDDTRYTYSVRVGDGSAVDGPSSVLAVQGDAVVTKITAVSASSFGDNVTVKVVSDNGTKDTVVNGTDVSEGVAKEYTIPTSGTGAYRVIMTAGTGNGLTTVYYDLIVLSDIEEVRSGIIVQGA